MAGKKAKITAPHTEPLPELSGMVTVVGVGGFLKVGQEYTVSAVLAQTLIKKGSATLKS